MEIIKIKIESLKHPEKNVRKHPQKQINEAKRSLEMFGQFRPIVIDENNTILAGNGIVMAMRELGWAEADVLQYKNLTENEKKKLMIADNQVASLGVDDYAAIEEVLKSLDGDYDVPGYDEETLSMLVEEFSAVADDIASYGTFAAEEVDKLNEVAEKREANGFEEVKPTPAQVAPTYEATAENVADGKVYAKPIEEGGRYIICPHCNEKIYI